MHVPQWLALTIAVAVILFGCFRIYLAVAGKPDEERAQYRRGMYAMPRWQHGLVGTLFIVVGGALIATALGWNPVAARKPAEDGAPRRPGKAIIIDRSLQLPPAPTAAPAPSPAPSQP